MTHRKELFLSVAFALVLWILISGLVFVFRHPWMTDTQRLLHLPEAMLFQRIAEPMKDDTHA